MSTTGNDIPILGKPSLQSNENKKAMGAVCFHGFFLYETEKNRRLHLRKGAASC